MKQKNHRGGYLSALMLLLSVMLIFSFQGGAMAGTLSKVERLTDAEKSELFATGRKVVEAQREVENVRARIAEAHGMQSEEYMEWRSWVEFDGDYIVLRRQSYWANYEFNAR